jgi:ABC-type nitrate/sulfonate/bicarbonate transport system substrate-binding protein
MTNNLDDYYLVTSQSEARPGRWSWEIRRISKPLGVKLTADGFQSDMAAQFAGKRALANFLSNLLILDAHPADQSARLRVDLRSPSARDPFLTSALHQSDGRILADGSNGLASYKRYYLSSAAFADRHGEALNVIFGKLAETGKWVKTHPKDAATLLAGL